MTDATTAPIEVLDQDQTTPADNTAQQIAATTNRWRMPGDVVARTCETLPDDQRRELKWLAGFARQRNLTSDEVGGLLKQPGSDRGYSGDSVYAVLTGRRDAGSMERFCESVAELRQRMEETAPRAKTQFVETSLTRKIFIACQQALARNKLTFIFGESQIGKTTAISEYAARHNHGETILVRMPTRGGLTDFLEELAIRLGISPQTKTKELRRRIMESFDNRTLLIVDECHECLRSHYSDRALATLDFVREIYDRRKCGVVLVGTNVFRSGLRTHKILKQLWLRGYRPLQLPAIPAKANLDEFARTFGLDPAPQKTIKVELTGIDDDGREIEETFTGNPSELEAKVLETFGLGRWLSLLEDAGELARERGTRVRWSHVIAAHHTLAKLESAS